MSSQDITPAGIDASMGMKYDAGKTRWDLVVWGIVEGIARVLTFGAKKYAPYSWRGVPDAKERYWSALMRHLIEWRQGEWLDPESGMPHLWHAACNLMFLYELSYGEEVCK